MKNNKKKLYITAKIDASDRKAKKVLEKALRKLNCTSQILMVVELEEDRAQR